MIKNTMLSSKPDLTDPARSAGRRASPAGLAGPTQPFHLARRTAVQASILTRPGQPSKSAGLSWLPCSPHGQSYMICLTQAPLLTKQKVLCEVTLYFIRKRQSSMLPQQP
jgi:hypothetical protein